jgi:cell division septation protein DedD
VPAPATPSTTAPSTPPSQAPGRAAAPAEAAAARSESLTAPPSVYWVQVGAFLDHKNADRLAERIRGEGLAAATSAFEQSRVLYRVFLAGPDEGSTSVPDEVVGRAKGLGHTVETTADGPAVTGAVPLRKAVETSHALRQQGFRVRLKQEVSSSTFRVVTVGSFATVAEAEVALATLTAKGVEGGIVVRER